MHGVAFNVDVAENLRLRGSVAGGPGPQWMFIHGLGDNGRVWDDIVRRVSLGRAAASVDLRGHGDSDWASHGDYQRERYVADVCRIIRTLNFDRVILVGHSLGGEIALHIAASYPGLVVGLALMDFSPEPDSAGLAAIRSALRARLGRFADADAFEDLLRHQYPLVPADIVRRVAEHSIRDADDKFVTAKFDPAVVPEQDERAEAWSSRLRLWELLAALLCPVLIVRGVASSILTNAVARKMASVVGDKAHLVVVPAAGHAVVLENQSACGESLLDLTSFCDAGRETRRC